MRSGRRAIALLTLSQSRNGLGQLLRAFQNPVDDAVLFRFLGRQIQHPIRILVNFLDGLTRVAGENFQCSGLIGNHFLGADLDIGRLPLGTRAGLVEHDSGMGEAGPIALGASGEDHGSGAHGLPYTDGVDWGLDVAEGVADSEGFSFVADRIPVVPGGTRRVDVEENGLFGIVKLQIEQLSDD